MQRRSRKQTARAAEAVSQMRVAYGKMRGRGIGKSDVETIIDGTYPGEQLCVAPGTHGCGVGRIASSYARLPLVDSFG